MKILWCWRCEREVPMLEGAEGKRAYELYGECLRGSPGNTISDKFKELFDYYKNITGEEYTNPNVIIHHIVELYGPPCEKCSKPYRTSKSSFCAACGHKRI